jgi:hypothetical protein
MRFGIDQRHRPHPGIAGQGMPGDQAARVVADNGDIFEAEEDLIGEVLFSLGGELQGALGSLFTAPVDHHLDIVRRAWPRLATAKADPVFALFFEASGLSMIGLEPYCTLVPALMNAWVDWAATFLTGTAAQRRGNAEAAVAMLDGLLMFRHTAGHAEANRAARRLLGG